MSRWIPTDVKKKIGKEKAELLSCLRDIIRERRKSIQPGNIDSYGDDLIGLLLADRDKRLAAAGLQPEKERRKMSTSRINAVPSFLLVQRQFRHRIAMGDRVSWLPH
jgi:hypothetical protein